MGRLGRVIEHEFTLAGGQSGQVCGKIRVGHGAAEPAVPGIVRTGHPAAIRVMPRHGKRDVIHTVTLANNAIMGAPCRGTGWRGISALCKITTWQRSESG